MPPPAPLPDASTGTTASHHQQLISTPRLRYAMPPSATVHCLPQQPPPTDAEAAATMPCPPATAPRRACVRPHRATTTLPTDWPDSMYSIASGTLSRPRNSRGSTIALICPACIMSSACFR